MISFTVSIFALIIGYLLYGRFVERVFKPDNRPTPAISKADGVDYVTMPNWKVLMIQFLNIDGTGSIFGAVMGAKFGPSSYLWIVLGCIFAGAVHDYMTGMLSMRNEGAGYTELVGRYLGNVAKRFMLVFSIMLLVMLGVVFAYSPAAILASFGGDIMMWIGIIFAYYIIATMLPIDKIIGRFYPIFAFALLFMAASLLVMLFVKWPTVPEVWTHLYNMGFEAQPEKWTENIFPALFITIACGAISGFHATQSPLMARCLKSEKMGRPIFYGSMITEGVVALVWATIASWFFYGEPTPGMELLTGAGNEGFYTSAPALVTLICNNWLGVVGAVLALLGVVAAPLTSGDTAFRSARLIIADFIKLDQHSVHKRLYICVPLFALAIVILIWQITNPDGFNIIWRYFGWSNQTLSVFALWTATVYLARSKKNFWITLIPALFMTTVCSTFFFISKQMLGLPELVAYPLGIVCLIVAAVWFTVWYRKETKNE